MPITTPTNPNVQTPSYDRAGLVPSVVHFGVGGFHRAHQALYYDRLLSTGERGWSLCGVGVRESDAAMRDAMAAQDCCYTLVECDPSGAEHARVIGSIVKYLFAPDDPQAVVDQLADTATRIVSLTVTEGGYEVSDVTGEFAPSDPATLHDLGGGLPRQSALGLVIEGLRVRREQGSEPFVVVSCDNVQGNGHVARTAITSFARRLDPDLADWIEARVHFPNSMVDRITPAMTPETREAINERYGVDDAWPIRAESFIQWVLEDDFPHGRPALETVGVQVVSDVMPYERMKLRLLNAAHQAIGYLGLLGGLTHVHEVATDDDYLAFLRHYFATEGIPSVGEVPDTDLTAYTEQLLERFGSTAIADTLRRLVFDGSERMAKFLMPVARDRVAAGGSIDACAMVTAAWSLYLDGHRTGHFTNLEDHRADELLALVAREAAEPGAFLNLEGVFGELAEDARFRERYLHWRQVLARSGPKAAIAELLETAR